MNVVVRVIQSEAGTIPNGTKYKSVVCFTHTALHIFKFGQDIKGEAVGLASGPISAIHEVSESQNQTQNLLHCLTVLQCLQGKQE